MPRPMVAKAAHDPLARRNAAPWPVDCQSGEVSTRKKSSATRLRVMVVDDDQERGATLNEDLSAAGYEDIVHVLASTGALLAEVERFAPDLIIIDTESPDRDTLENLFTLSGSHPRPIVMFSGDRDSATIRAAVRAGVSAYVVDGLAPASIKPVIDAAVATFEQLQKVRGELAEAQVRLDERKQIEKAKGLIMERKRVSEDDAFKLLRKMAMDRNVRLGKIAEEVIRLAELI